MHPGLFYVPLHNPHVVLQCFGEHFAEVLGGGGDITLSTQDRMDTLVCEVESSLGAKGEVCDKPRALGHTKLTTAWTRGKPPLSPI